MKVCLCMNMLFAGMAIGNQLPVFWAHRFQLSVQHDLCLQILPNARGRLFSWSDSRFLFYVCLWWMFNDRILGVILD